MAAKFGAREAARLETVYASPAIAAQRARTRAALGARPGERGLDVGCGPAFLACELGREVGPAGRIVGLDESPEMLEAARARIAREGLADRVEVQQGDAARLAFPAGRLRFRHRGPGLPLRPRHGGRAGGSRARPPARAAAWRSSIPTGTPACGSRPTAIGIAGSWRRAARTSSSHTCRPGCRGSSAGQVSRLAHAEAIPVLELSGSPGTFSGGLIGPTADLAVRYGVPREEAEAWRTDLLARAAGGEYFFSLTRYLFVATRPGD